MKTVWTKGMNPDEAEEVEADFRASQRLRERLEHLLEEKMRAKRAYVRKDEHYEKSSWPLLQADYIGYERALEEIISLISSRSE